MWYSSGELALFEDRLADAEQAYESALSYFLEVDEARGHGLAMRGLALIARLRGQLDESLQRYEVALRALRSADDRFAEAHVLSGMAQVHIDRGEHEQAAQLLEEGLAISLEIGALRAEAQVRHRLGHLYLAQGQLDEAESAFTAVLDTVAKLADPVGTTYARLGIGLVRIARCCWAGAELVLREARLAAEDTGDRLSLGRVLLAQAEVAHGTGDMDLVESRLEEARTVFGAAGATLWLERAGEVAERLGVSRAT